MSQSSGFAGAPITSLASTLVLLLSLFCGGGGGPNRLSFTARGFANGQLWRLFTGSLVFDSMPETILGLIILYTCGTFERQMGLRKYGAYFCIVFVIYWLLQLAIFLALGAIRPDLVSSYIPKSGPYFIIFALLKYFHLHVPKVLGRRFTLFGRQFSISPRKLWVYILSLQLCFSSGFTMPRALNSVLAAVCGVLAGYIYDNSRGLQLNRYLLPRSFEALSDRIAGMRSYGALNNRNLNNGDNFAMPPFNNNNNNYNNNNNINGPMVPAPPSEAQVEALMALGFGRLEVLDALTAAGNDSDAAAEYLYSR